MLLLQRLKLIKAFVNTFAVSKYLQICNALTFRLVKWLFNLGEDPPPKRNHRKGYMAKSFTCGWTIGSPTRTSSTCKVICRSSQFRFSLWRFYLSKQSLECPKTPNVIPLSLKNNKCTINFNSKFTGLQFGALLLMATLQSNQPLGWLMM